MNVGIDKYYTKQDVVKQCISWFKTKINVNKTDLIIEPSAGNGSFISELEKITCIQLYYDIEPQHPNIIQHDYLNVSPNMLPVCENIHVIGNPPFGKKSSLAIKFIKYSCAFCDTISFILPKSFKKDSLKKCFPLNFDIVFQEELPMNSFILDKKECNVPCVFQIWKKNKYNRIPPLKLHPQGFHFVKKHDNPDISFRRVGVYAGKIKRDCNVSPESHYFLKFDTKLSLDLYNTLSEISFDDCKYNTVGSNSISRQELISKYNKFINKNI